MKESKEQALHSTSTFVSPTFSAYHFLPNLPRHHLTLPSLHPSTHSFTSIPFAIFQHLQHPAIFCPSNTSTAANILKQFSIFQHLRYSHHPTPPRPCTFSNNPLSHSTGSSPTIHLCKAPGSPVDIDLPSQMDEDRSPLTPVPLLGSAWWWWWWR